MTTRITYIVILAMNLPAYASGQSALHQGDRVRIHHLNGTVVTGIVQSASPQAVRLLEEPRGTEFVIPGGEVGQIERSLGRHREFGRNFRISVASSAVAIGVISAISWKPCVETGFQSCFLEPTSRSGAFQFGLVVGAIVGTPIGIIVGSGAKQERWEWVSFAGHSQAALSIQPILGRGFGLSASFAF